jgi:hypothetical protein
MESESPSPTDRFRMKRNEAGTAGRGELLRSEMEDIDIYTYIHIYIYTYIHIYIYTSKHIFNQRSGSSKQSNVFGIEFLLGNRQIECSEYYVMFSTVNCLQR